MNRTFYLRIRNAISARPRLLKLVVQATAVLPGLVYLSYPLLLLYLLVAKSPWLLRAVLVPLGGFLLVTVLRAAINAPRPYEALALPSLTPKATRGKSFPSRHAACGAVIAVTALKVLPPAGITLCIVAVLIGVSRVLSGVHFVRDALCGLGLGALVGWIGMFLV